MPFSALLLLISLGVFSAFFFFMSHRKHRLGIGADQRIIDVRILNKQAIELPDADQLDDGLQYWIYVQPLKGGPKREFEINVHYYDALQAGDRGTMTYQGLQFIHFAKHPLCSAE